MDANEQSVQCRTRIYILLLIGGVLFPDTFGSHIHMMFLPLLEDFGAIRTYSWGSACLAWLYRYLCRASQSGVSEIGGACILL